MRTHYGPWQPCWISNQHQKHKSGRGSSSEHFWQVWLISVQRFQRRRFKCEKLTDGRTDAYPWQKLTWPMARWAKNEKIPMQTSYMNMECEVICYRTIHYPKKMVKSEWSIIIFSRYFKIQFAWPTFQKRSWSVMTITSTNRKGKNAWEIPSLKTYLTSIMIRKKDINKKDLFYMHGIYSIQSYLF